MKTFEIKTLLFVAAVACLPIACGTSSVTGPDAASLVGPQGTVSAQRSIEPLPPTAPLPDPNNEPVPQVPTSDDVPQTGSGGAPTHQPAHQPAPGTDPSQTDPDPTGTPDPSPVPLPAPAPEQCLVASIEIVELNTFASTPGLALEAILFDEKHVAITDSGCDKLEWRIEATEATTGSEAGPTATILYGADPRYVSVSGPAGVYKVGVTMANGAGGSRLIDLK